MLNSSRTPAPPHVVIVGGGLAGLAAASALAGHDVRISLIESRPRLGGRASSFIDPATGESVDNCQHVSMTCCTNLADFCRRVKIHELFRREEAIVFLSPEGRTSTLRAGFLPAPLHLAGSFLRANYLRWSEKLRVAYGLACLRSTRDDRPGESFADWLLRHGQTIRTINLYWATVLVSALNERLEQMDVGHARKVFIDGFLRNRDGFRMEIPLVPLGELYGTRLENWLRDHDVAVRLTTGVRAVRMDPEGEIRGVTLRSGETIDADFVVMAVPFDRVRALLPVDLLAKVPALTSVDVLQASPITGVHLWFDRSICPYDHVVTVGRLIQWVFNHTAIQGRSTMGQGGEYLQLVISASYDLLALDKTAILDAIMAELAEIWPATREATLVRSWVVTEHGATFAVRPGVEAHRPSQRTPVDGFFLAGDWTDTGWPATMEGAVRSGYRVAEGILEDLGRPTPLVCPELATEPLAGWLLGANNDQEQAGNSRTRNRSSSARLGSPTHLSSREHRAGEECSTSNEG
ncbi:hydroxysqualene dehydroxylase HpnE [Singulisphaera acidiphila]|uniref:Squalene-associated FAD-dependent desaturase n=1 Tax=Singulisphaera acidiphila (strain ATCC BAA-1392 / DSM 18658 / VKM B-2454 / MOB10) TaxID=886293 RepID=L0DJ37_SINAD|nr:hydroxysqualene dehydroxylase HpnE [Singulisphaera acidiphila]AGA29374.1 squalene-associated FAD-dependent desaturase [Singulisphaera acidiphila DSM 18658]